MSFAHPTWLFALLALPLVAVWMGWLASLRARRLSRYANREFWPSVAGSVSWRRKRIRLVLRLGAVAFFIIAAARPQWGVKERPLVREGSDMFICLDVSTSMLARDIAPSRLASAKRQIRSLIYNLKGDRVGLILFAGDAFVQCPLTVDYGLAVNLLEAAGPDSVSVQGTRIGVAIATALRAFDRSALGTKSIILVTDGEDQGSKPVEEAERAAADGIVIQCVGIGTTQGMPILLQDGTYKEDRQGRTVTSRLDADTLRKIALATGGEAVVTDSSGNMDLDSLYKQIKNYEKRQFESREINLLEDRFQWPLSAGVLLLVAELFLGDRVRERREGRRFFIRRSLRIATGGAGVVLLIVLSPRPAHADGWEFGNRAARLCQQGNRALEQGDLADALAKYYDAQVIAPDNPVLDYNIGVVLARQQKWEEARSAFQDAARKAGEDPSLRAKALYNAAITHYEDGKRLSSKEQLDQAIAQAGHSIDANQKALDLQSDFGEAEHNLGESRQLLRKLVEMKKTAQQQQQQQQGDQQQQEGDEKQKQDQQQSGEQNQENKEEGGQYEQEKNQQQAGSQDSAVTPTPTVTPQSENQQQEQEEQKQQKAQQQEGGQSSETQQARQADETTLGEMTKEDAIRLLSTLPTEDPQALQRALQEQQGSTQLEKDW